jgi:hypothetical protein
MKLSVALLAGLISTVSFAETCFKADAPIPSYVKVPEILCVKDHGLKYSNRAQDIYYSFVETSIGYNQKTVRFILDSKSENFQHDIVTDEYDGGICDDYKQTLIRINFTVDPLAQNVKGSLQVKAEYSYSSDTCHSDTYTDEISYSQI